MTSNEELAALANRHLWGQFSSLGKSVDGMTVIERDDFLGNVMTNEATFRAALDDLADLPIVGDVRGMGYFYGIELVKDPDTKETFTLSLIHI